MTFESVKLQHVHAGARASAETVKRVGRLQKKADRVGGIAPHALMLEADLVEYDPPAGTLPNHFAVLRQHEQRLQSSMRPA